MGSKKKKGLSNRLAKMSDEERARYLQHRAAIEEEARRRKEQLIETYMKNKLKREEAFTRLNIAKINEQWHQLLRRIKIKELQTEIEEISGWITKILLIKNSIIKTLLQEQEEAEEQYVHNLQSHLSHVDHFVDMHYGRQKDLKYDFIQHKESTVNDALKELDKHIIGANKQERYLKTVLFTMETNFNDIQKQLKTFRDNRLEDQSNSLKAVQETMVKNYSMTMDKQWRDINSILSEYLARTTVRRHHYIELKHLDERHTTERLDNERRITRYTEQINSLNFEYELLTFKNETQIKDLEELKSIESEKFRKSKHNLTYLIRKDEKLLENLTVTSNNSIKTLEDVIEKGKTVLQWITYCRRLESDEETLICWAKIHKKLDQFEEVSVDVASLKSKEDSAKEEGVDSTSVVESKKDKDSKSVDSKMEKGSAKSEEDISKIEDLPKDIEEIFNAESVIDSSEMDLLDKMSGLCWCINRAEIDCMELKIEKLDLIASNQNIKGIIKGILRDAALEPPVQVNLGNYYQVRPKILSAPSVMIKQLSFIVIDL